MEDFMRYAALLAAAVVLAACSGSGERTMGRAEPGGSAFDPLCMPDGSVVFYEYANRAGQYDEVTANKANCPWNRAKASVR
jgi:hypothetical protein